MRLIPVQDVAAQTLRVVLDGQSCSLRLFQKTGYGLFCDLKVDDAAVISGVVCRNRTRIVRDGWLGFRGDLFFVDGQGTSDPAYPGLGTRFQLYYLESKDEA